MSYIYIYGAPIRAAQSVGLLWTSDQLVAETSTWQHTTLTTDKYPSWVQIPPGAWIFVCCECRVLSGRGLCDDLITRPEESYQLCCVVVCDLETSRMGAPYIYDISRLRVKNRIPNIFVLGTQWTQLLNRSLINPMYQLIECLHCGHYRCIIYTQNNKIITEQNSCTQQNPFWIKIRESSEN